MALISNYLRTTKIDKIYHSIGKRFTDFCALAKFKKDDITLSYLKNEIRPLLEELNDAYCEDNKATKAMVKLFDIVDYCLEKSMNVYKIKCKEPFHRELINLIVEFLEKDYLRNGRKGLLTLEQVSNYNKKFDAHYNIIVRLADKLSKAEQYSKELKEAQQEIKKANSMFISKSQKEIVTNSAASKYNSAVYFLNNYRKSIDDDRNQLRSLQAKEENEFLYNDTVAANVHENVGQAMFIQEQMDQDHKSIENDTRNLFGDSATLDLHQLTSKDEVTPENLSEKLNEASKILDRLSALESKIDVYHTETAKEIKFSRSQEQSHFDKLSNKLDDLKAELSKLDNGELIQRIAHHFENIVQKEENGEKDIPEKSESVFFEEELKDRNISIKDTIQYLLQLDSPFNYIGSYAILRSLIDSWCRYTKGIELNNKQRIFALVDDNGNVLSNNYSIFSFVFGQNGKVVNKIWIDCNSNVHADVTQQNNADKIREQTKILVDDLGLDFSKIDYVEGVKRLYAQEVESINHFVDSQPDSDNLANPDTAPKDTYKYAINRLNKYKTYLSGKVDSSFFDEVGAIKQFSPSAL